MSGHTPGPWTADPEYPYKVRDASGRMVGVAIACIEDTRLIAAAPVLLLALSWLVGLKDERPDDYEEQKPLAWAAARAALALVSKDRKAAS